MPSTHDAFQSSVVRAVERLGMGFLSHPENTLLRDRLGSDELRADEYARQLVRVVYRLLFLCIAEDRGLLHPTDADADARARYRAEYSMRLLRDSVDHAGDAGADDLWHRLGAVFKALGEEGGSPELGLPGIGTFLWTEHSTPDLLSSSQKDAHNPVRLRDRDLLRAVHALAFAGSEGYAEAVDFTALSSRTLGSAYEALLELVPGVDLRSSTFSLRSAPGNERKSTGSYYTPESLIEHLLDSALEPTVDRRLHKAAGDAEAQETALRDAEEAAILRFTVCDPASGSGHFLIAAAHRLAHRLALVRTGTSEPAPNEHKHALRDVIRCCIYGLDINPMAAELCRIALWMESGEHCGVLRHLESRIKIGNALLGATPEVLYAPLPDAAFQTFEDDHRDSVKAFRLRNRREIRAREHDAPGAPMERSTHRSLADAWCAAFVWPKTADVKDAITQDTLDSIRAHGEQAIQPSLREQINRLAEEHGFFHWHLAFPEVFGSEGSAGFDCLVGNPPFLNQLESDTAAHRRHAAMLEVLSDGAVRGYTDIATAFLLASARMCKESGRIALVQPQSLLAAKDARRLRRAVLEHASLVQIWVSNEHIFEGATVYTCAPTLERSASRMNHVERFATGRFDRLPEIEIDQDALRGEETWSHLVSDAFGVPRFEFIAGGTIGDLADATADFRDQYYGLDSFLVEDAELSTHASERDLAYPPIVTTGLIDLGVCDWSVRSTRILKTTWDAPRIDRDRMLAEGTLGDWIDSRLVPKIILATQTKVLEIFVDNTGRFVPSLPLITLTPKGRRGLWHIASALASPVCTAIAMQRYSGVALSAQAIKLSAKQSLLLPVPQECEDWDAAADVLRQAHEADDARKRYRHLLEFGARSIAAYRIPAEEASALLAWWSTRLGEPASQNIALDAVSR